MWLYSLDSLRKAFWFSTHSLTCGYWRVRARSHAYVARRGLFDAGFRFQRLIGVKFFRGLHNDITVSEHTFQEHLVQLHEELSKFNINYATFTFSLLPLIYLQITATALHVFTSCLHRPGRVP